MIHTDGIPTIANCGPVPGQPHKRSLVNDIVAYELDELSEDEVIDLFQRLVDSGAAWKLQGHYGRTAAELINAGLVTVA